MRSPIMLATGFCRGEDFCGEHAENIDRAALGSDVAPAENSSRLCNHVERMLI
jgi:hypothetical protein